MYMYNILKTKFCDILRNFTFSGCRSNPLNVIHVDIPLGNEVFRICDPNMAMNMLNKRCFYIGLKDWFPGDDRDENAPCFEYALASDSEAVKLQHQLHHYVL